MNSHPIPPISNFIKKKGEKIHEGGLGQNPLKKRKGKETDKEKHNKKISRLRITKPR
jgi:hypothetical protein